MENGIDVGKGIVGTVVGIDLEMRLGTEVTLGRGGLVGTEVVSGIGTSTETIGFAELTTSTK